MPSYLPDSDSEDELPPAWEERATEDGYVFYINHHTKITQWTHPRTGKIKRVPQELPIGWESRTEADTGKNIFINSETNQETYTDPRLAFAVEETSQKIGEVRQRFDSSTNALQILHGRDLTGKLAVITGANAGIGFETAKSLALHGCEVIIGSRNKLATENAIAKIAKEKPSAGEKCSYIQLDLSSLNSAKQFVKVLKTKVKHIDMLILNAGIFGIPYCMTEDGYETTFQVCHLSHFYMALELESLLDHVSRVVIVSSESHRFSNFPQDQLTEQILSPPASKYYNMIAYNNAKLCNVLFARELAKKWKHKGTCIYVLHPGNMVSTGISRYWWFYRILFSIVRPFTKSLQQAASTTIYCATATELTGFSGNYYNNCFFCEPSKLGQNDELAQSLWAISEELVRRIFEK